MKKHECPNNIPLCGAQGYPSWCSGVTRHFCSDECIDAHRKLNPVEEEPRIEARSSSSGNYTFTGQYRRVSL